MLLKKKTLKNMNLIIFICFVNGCIKMYEYLKSDIWLLCQESKKKCVLFVIAWFTLRYYTNRYLVKNVFRINYDYTLNLQIAKMNQQDFFLVCLFYFIYIVVLYKKK